MSSRLVIVATYATPTEAQIARNHLKTAGITAYVSGGATADALSLVGTALGGVKLEVPQSDVQRARALLFPEETENLAPQGSDDAEDASAAPWNCPECDTEIAPGFDVCWSCGTTRDGTRDPSFADDVPADEAMDQDEPIAAPAHSEPDYASNPPPVPSSVAGPVWRCPSCGRRVPQECDVCANC